MSSKIYAHSGGKQLEPLLFRQVYDPAPAPEEADDSRQEELRREYEVRIQQARAAGYQEGMAAAGERAAAELRAVMDRVAATAAEIAALRQRLRRQAEGDLVQLSMAIARRILHRELAVDPEAMRGLVVLALEKIQAQEITRVRIHAAHAVLLRACLERISAERVEILPDAGLPPGGVVIETERGNLDASVETQLEEIGRGLTDRLRQERS